MACLDVWPPARPEALLDGMGPAKPGPSTAEMLSASLQGRIHSVSRFGSPRSRHSIGLRLTAEFQR